MASPPEGNYRDAAIWTAGRCALARLPAQVLCPSSAADPRTAQSFSPAPLHPYKTMGVHFMGGMHGFWKVFCGFL